MWSGRRHLSGPDGMPQRGLWLSGSQCLRYAGLQRRPHAALYRRLRGLGYETDAQPRRSGTTKLVRTPLNGVLTQVALEDTGMGHPGWRTVRPQRREDGVPGFPTRFAVKRARSDEVIGA